MHLKSQRRLQGSKTAWQLDLAHDEQIEAKTPEKTTLSLD